MLCFLQGYEWKITSSETARDVTSRFVSQRISGVGMLMRRLNLSHEFHIDFKRADNRPKRWGG